MTDTYCVVCGWLVAREWQASRWIDEDGDDHCICIDCAGHRPARPMEDSP